MNPDEPTPDELYRPASEVLPVTPGSYAPVPVQHHMPAVPDAYPPAQQNEQGAQLPPSGLLPSGEHVTPQQGQPWGSAPAQQYQSAADETQVIPPAIGPEPLDETQQIPRAHPPAQRPPVQQPQPHVPPQVAPQVPPPPAEPPSARPRQGPPAAPAASPAASPFTIRPGLPTSAYGGRPSSASSEEGGEETQLLPPIAAEPPGYGQGPAQPHPTQPYAAQPHPQQAFHGPPSTPQGPPPAQPYPAQPHATQPHAAHPDSTQAYPPQPPGPRSRRAAASTGSRLSPAALAGIVVGGCAVAGLIAGAALSSGGDEEGTGTVAKKSAAATSTPSPSAVDPAKAQATELDTLLKDSNSSRSSVINAVEEIKACKNLSGAAQDLRDAAAQRNDLVSRLAGIEVDKLQNHARLTAALNKAWASSASADNHYAAWADQAGGKGGCKKGRPKPSPHIAAGNRASGEATEAKQRAARLWNAVAKEYGLTQRAAHQL